MSTLIPTFCTEAIEYDRKIRLRKTMNVFKGRFDFIEKLNIATIGFTAGFTNIEMMDLAVEDILITLPYRG